jgi:hypothetical protein
MHKGDRSLDVNDVNPLRGWRSPNRGKQAGWWVAFALAGGRLEFEFFESAGSTLPAALKEKT